MKELLLIRHGEAEHHVNGLTGGWTNSALTEKGRWQSHRAAARLKKMLSTSEFEIVASDLTRARHTAEIIAHGLDRPLLLEPGLRELNNGVAKDKSHAEARQLARPRTEPVLDWVPHQDAESWRMLYHRIVECMERIRGRGGDTVLVVSHGHAIVCIIHWWLRITEDHHLENVMYDTAAGAITHLKSDSLGCRVIHRLNDTSHLDE